MGTCPRFLAPPATPPQARLQLPGPVDIIDSAHIELFFRMLMDVPLRKSKLLRAQWNDYDAERGILRVTSTSRNKRTGTQPLTPEIVATLNKSPRPDDNGYISPTPDGTAYLKDVDSQRKRIKTNVGSKDARLPLAVSQGP